MVSEKLKSILLSRTDFTREEIDKLNETEGWKIVYSLDALDKETKLANRPKEICFTGFARSDRERLSQIAMAHGFLVKDLVTKELFLLVAGENAGPSKLKKAEGQGCKVTDEKGFLDLLDHTIPRTVS